MGNILFDGFFIMTDSLQAGVTYWPVKQTPKHGSLNNTTLNKWETNRGSSKEVERFYVTSPQHNPLVSVSFSNRVVAI